MTDQRSVANRCNQDDRKDCNTIRIVNDSDKFTFPSMAIETTTILFQPNPSSIKLEGSLHPNRKGFLTNVVEMENGRQGCYAAFDLRRYPHYQVDRCRGGSKAFRTAVLAMDTPHVVLQRTSSHTHSEVGIVVNDGTKEFSSISGLFNKLPFQNYMDRYLEQPPATTTPSKQTPDPVRASIKWHYGFATLNLKVPDGELVAIPAVNMGIDDDAIRCMEKMTALLKALCTTSNIRYPFAHQPERKERFSGSLTTNRCGQTGSNDIEALSIGITTFNLSSPSKNEIFPCHVDANNDPEQDCTVCAYRFYICDGTVYRVAILGYSRKSIGDYIRRTPRVLDYSSNLNEYIQNNKDRWYHPPSVVPTTDPATTTTARPTDAIPTYHLPSFDKLGNLSVVLDALETIGVSWNGISWHEMVELLLPIAICGSSLQLALVYRNMAESTTSCPTKVVTTTANACFGSLTMHVLHMLRGQCALHQNKLHSSPPTDDNNKPTKEEVVEALATLTQEFRMCLQSCPPPYKTLLHRVSSGMCRQWVRGLPDLISIAATLGIVPQWYVGEAEFQPGTKTANDMNPVVGNSKIALQNLFQRLADTHKVSVSFIEKANTEFVHDCKANKFVFCQDNYCEVTAKRLREHDGLVPILPKQRLYRQQFCLNKGTTIVERINNNGQWELYHGIDLRNRPGSDREWKDNTRTNSQSGIPRSNKGRKKRKTQRRTVQPNNSNHNNLDTNDDDNNNNNDDLLSERLKYDTDHTNNHRNQQSNQDRCCIAYPNRTYDPTFSVPRKPPETMLTKVLPNYLEVISSTINNERIYWFDTLMEALGVLSSKKDLRVRRPTLQDFPRKRRLWSYVSFEMSTPPFGSVLYSATINSEANVTVKAKDLLAPSTGAVANYTCGPRQWYATRRHALRALIANILLRAKNRRDSQGHPCWASRILPPTSSEDGDFRILMQPTAPRDSNIFAILVWKYNRHHLLVPKSDNSFYGTVEHFILNNSKGETKRVQ